MSGAAFTSGANGGLRDADAMAPLAFTLNGRPVRAMVEPRTSLADFLRDERHLTGTHVSCEQGVCGACTVLLDERPVRACITWALACDGASVTTIEAMDDDPTMARLRDAFSREHALQCGFCTPGMLITARDMALRGLPGDDARVREELAGNLCRCTGYSGIVRAVCSVLEQSDTVAASALEARGGAGSGVAVGGVPATLPASAAHGAPPVSAALRARPAVADGRPAPGGADAGGAGRATPSAAGAATITETIEIGGVDADRLWSLLADVKACAGCLPGARIDHYDGRALAGAVKVAFGPVSASFAGEGEVSRDEAARRTVIQGTGRDSLSKTSARATIVYQVEPITGRRDAARLVVSLEPVIEGPLAQFSRGDLMRSLVAQLLRDFGRNLEALASGGQPSQSPSSGQLGLVRLLWRWLLGRLGLSGSSTRDRS